MAERDEVDEVQKLDLWRPLSWSAIIYGALLALALSIMLHILGLGITATLTDPNSSASENIATVGGVSGIWFLVATAISLFVGGFVASTISRTFSEGRAAIYGLGVWALCTLATMSVVVPAIVRGAGTTLNVAGAVVDRTASALGAVGSTATQAAQNVPSGLTSQVQQVLLGTTNLDQADQTAVRDVTRLLGLRVIQGNWTQEQRDQLIKNVARVANISPDDARRRVEEAENTLNQAVQQAQQTLRQAAEATRTALAAASYWAFAALLIGAIAALFGARYGELDESELPTFARMRFSRPHHGT
jgi:hypothetical protein